MCKRYIDNKIEMQIVKASHSLRDILYRTSEFDDRDSKSFLSVREARKKLLSARAHINNALKESGKLERIRRVRPNDKSSQKQV